MDLGKRGARRKVPALVYALTRDEARELAAPLPATEEEARASEYAVQQGRDRIEIAAADVALRIRRSLSVQFEGFEYMRIEWKDGQWLATPLKLPEKK